ncbi:MAG: hypothetical protein P4L11_13620 [Geothrix sp.]|nr:hypothetical protein [Geothrix sp.]
MAVVMACGLMGGLSAKPSAKTPEVQRLETFNDLESDNVDKAYFRGVQQAGDKVVIRIADRWHLLSKDRREALAKGMFKRWFMLGAPLGLHEKPGAYHFEFRHAESDRLLATWDGLSGLSLKD